MALIGMLASATSVPLAFAVYGAGMVLVSLRPLLDPAIRGLRSEVGSVSGERD